MIKKFLTRYNFNYPRSLVSVSYTHLFSLFNFPLSIKKESLIEDVFEISKESSALIIQLPLPHKLDTYHLFDAIEVDKDVDLLSSRAIGRYYSGDFSIIPPTVSAISEILKGEDLVGKNVEMCIRDRSLS